MVLIDTSHLFPKLLKLSLFLDSFVLDTEQTWTSQISLLYDRVSR